jgi:hypothetical protein
MDKVNQVLELFNLQLGPVPIERMTDEWDVNHAFLGFTLFVVNIDTELIAHPAYDDRW